MNPQVILDTYVAFAPAWRFAILLLLLMWSFHWRMVPIGVGIMLFTWWVRTDGWEKVLHQIGQALSLG